MNAIDWSQVPKNARGQVDYAAITSLVARIMVAEEELTRLQGNCNAITMTMTHCACRTITLLNSIGLRPG